MHKKILVDMVAVAWSILNPKTQLPRLWISNWNRGARHGVLIFHRQGIQLQGERIRTNENIEIYWDVSVVGKRDINLIGWGMDLFLPCLVRIFSWRRKSESTYARTCGRSLSFLNRPWSGFKKCQKTERNNLMWTILSSESGKQHIGLRLWPGFQKRA
jgi:hypothetical protein